MYLWTKKELFNFGIKFWNSYTSGSTREFLKDSSTLQDKAFFQTLAHIFYVLNVFLLTGVSLICIFFIFVRNCYYYLICHIYYSRLLLEFN